MARFESFAELLEKKKSFGLVLGHQGGKAHDVREHDGGKLPMFVHGALVSRKHVKGVRS